MLLAAQSNPERERVCVCVCVCVHVHVCMWCDMTITNILEEYTSNYNPICTYIIATKACMH